jgi:CheY-like chemotaxis protein
MGGDLTVRSDGKSGACFTATFLAEPLGVDTATPPARVAGLNGRRVLVVDDNPLVRELFVTSLVDAGATCTAAGTAAEALTAIATEIPESIILDLGLPDEDGTRLAPQLRRAIPGVRIVGVSAHAGATEREQALAAGMDLFLTKPVALDELAAAVAGVTATIVTAPERAGLRLRLEAQFRGEAAAKQAELAAAIARGDLRRTRAIAHYLANSAAVVRDAALLETCVALAHAAEIADTAAIFALWAECETRLASWSAPTPPPHARTPG